MKACKGAHYDTAGLPYRVGNYGKGEMAAQPSMTACPDESSTRAMLHRADEGTPHAADEAVRRLRGGPGVGPTSSKRRKPPNRCPDCSTPAFGRQRDLRQHRNATGDIACEGKSNGDETEAFEAYLLRATGQAMRYVPRLKSAPCRDNTDGCVTGVGSKEDISILRSEDEGV